MTVEVNLVIPKKRLYQIEGLNSIYNLQRMSEQYKESFKKQYGTVPQKDDMFEIANSDVIIPNSIDKHIEESPYSVYLDGYSGDSNYWFTLALVRDGENVDEKNIEVLEGSTFTLEDKLENGENLVVVVTIVSE